METHNKMYCGHATFRILQRWAGNGVIRDFKRCLLCPAKEILTRVNHMEVR